MRSVAFVIFTPMIAFSQVMLQETLPAGAVVRNEMTLKFDGKMKLDRGTTAPMEGTGKHIYIERIDSERKSLRYYFEATASTAVGIEKSERKLPENRRLIVVERGASGVSFTAAVPMTREEHSLIAEHFDASQISRMLPDKTVNVNDTWPLRDDCVSAVCLFDSLVRNSLTAKLTEVKDGIANIAIEGYADGVENGSKVKLSVNAKLSFDVQQKRVTALTWEQRDDREQGPISPTIESKSVVTISRTISGESNASELKALDPSVKPTLIYVQPDNKFSFTYDPRWHAVVQTESHLVLRLLDRGEFVAQATIAPWKAADRTKSADEQSKAFFEAAAKTPGWTPDKMLNDGKLPTEKPHTIIRRVVSGKQDDAATVQSFALVTHANGAQVVVTCVVRPELLEKLDNRDAALAAAIEFPPAK